MYTEDWFSIETIDDDTFAISEYKHWEETHCYLLCGEKKAVLIDTGLGICNICNVVKHLTSLPVEVLTTHVHWDHIGGHKHFERIAVHKAEQSWLAEEFPMPLQMVKNNLLHQACTLPQDFSVDAYTIFRGTPDVLLHDSDMIDLGNRWLTVIHTPGHSPGHCCFYELDRKHLYSGDLIYLGCLDAFYPSTNPQQFWQSIQKIQAMEINRILPGHHQLSVPVTLINEIEAAFSTLSDERVLKHGAGIFDFGIFQIHI